MLSWLSMLERAGLEVSPASDCRSSNESMVRWTFAAANSARASLYFASTERRLSRRRLTSLSQYGAETCIDAHFVVMSSMVTVCLATAPVHTRKQWVRITRSAGLPLQQRKQRQGIALS